MERNIVYIFPSKNKYRTLSQKKTFLINSTMNEMRQRTMFNTIYKMLLFLKYLKHFSQTEK